MTVETDSRPEAARGVRVRPKQVKVGHVMKMSFVIYKEMGIK